MKWQSASLKAKNEKNNSFLEKKFVVLAHMCYFDYFQKHA